MQGYQRAKVWMFIAAFSVLITLIFTSYSRSLVRDLEAFDRLEEIGFRFSRWPQHDQLSRKGYPNDLVATNLKVTNAIVSDILELQSIRYMQFLDCEFDRDVLSRLNDACPLILLRWSGQHVTDARVMELRPAPSLRHLDCLNCTVTDEGVAHLCRCFPNLFVLRLIGSQISGKSAAAICTLQQLRSLGISTGDWDQADVLQVLRQLKLNNLTLPRSIVTDDFMREVRQICSPRVVQSDFNSQTTLDNEPESSTQTSMVTLEFSDQME